MFLKLTTHETLFLLSQFSGLSPKNLREFFLLNADNQKIVEYLIKGKSIKYSSVYKINSLDQNKVSQGPRDLQKARRNGCKNNFFSRQRISF